MASKFLNNLSNTYKRSPSLQNQFATEQDYLDLFGNQKTTPAMAKAYTPVVEKEGIKSITNTATPIINQTGSDNGGPTITGRKTGFSTQGAPYGSGKGGMHDDDEGKGLKGKFGLGSFMNIAGFIANPVGFFAKKAFNIAKQKYQNKKREDKVASDLALQEEINRANKEATVSARYARGDSLSDIGRDMYSGPGQAFEARNTGTGRGPKKEGGRVGFDRGGPTYSEEDFPILVSPRRKDGRKPSLSEYDNEYDNSNYKYDDDVVEIPSGKNGGRVGAKDGGSMIQIVKDRLMEKNPAMWGLGYEGLASLQDLIMSMPFNRGGIVNIRKR